MKTLINAALIGLSLTGCIVYDEELAFDDDFERTTDRPDAESGDEETNQTPSLSLDPSQAPTGELALISLFSEGSDLAQVADISFYGNSDLLVMAEQLRGDSEIILAIDIPNNAALGTNHLLVEFTDGTEVFMSDAFEVTD
jgi:hypothetical protein